MIWTFVGERNLPAQAGDIRKDIEKLLAVLRKKQPDAEVIRMEEGAFDAVFLDEIISSQGLFSPKYILIIENVDLKDEKNESLIEKLPLMKESEHAFLLSFEKVLADAKKKLEKYSYEYKAYEKKESFLKSKGSDFEMADRLGERDVVGLWQLFARKVTDEVGPEEMHGMFVWQVKGMLLALKTTSAKEANMNEYPYTKAKRYAKNFSQKELEELLFQLIKMYDEAHSGKADLKVELERWVLALGKK